MVNDSERIAQLENENAELRKIFQRAMGWHYVPTTLEEFEELWEKKLEYATQFIKEQGAKIASERESLAAAIFKVSFDGDTD
jgi:hypothetical protein